MTTTANATGSATVVPSARHRAVSAIVQFWRGMGLIGEIGLVICGLFCFAAIFGPMVVPVNADSLVAAPFLRPSGHYLFGTDELGRSEFSRTVVAARVAILAAFESVFVGIAIGTPIGVCAGMFGSVIDEVLGRLMDLLFSIPAILLAITVIVVLGPGLTHATFALGIVFAPQFGRIARTATIEVRGRAYVEAARLSGRGTLWIIVRHVLPNITTPMSVMVGLILSNALGFYAVLSYLGFGVPPPTPDYGTMLFNAQGYLLADPWLIGFPSLALVVLILGFLFVGDGLRQQLDPENKVVSRGILSRQ
jgi:peptide/nickel transport system permease protein